MEPEVSAGVMPASPRLPAAGWTRSAHFPMRGRCCMYVVMSPTAHADVAAAFRCVARELGSPQDAAGLADGLGMW